MSKEIEFLINKMKLLETTEKIKPITVETKIHPLIAATKELCYEGVISNVDKELVYEHERLVHDMIESSPDTLKGSFTDDLNESKEWLCKLLANGLKGKNAGTIHVLGSWYGNIGVFLEKYNIKFDKLVLVETDEEKLLASRELLDKINDEGKLVLIHQNADDVVYETPGIVINTSCNETGPEFLNNVPKGMLCLLQARNSISSTEASTNTLEEFVEKFPLEKIIYQKEKTLYDPETTYERFMIIGKASGSLNEARMSPKAYRQAIETGASEGVLVGYEFEICVPNKNYQTAMDEKSLLQAIFKHEAVLGAITISETNDSAAGEFTPDTLDGLMIPINNPNVASFTESNEQYDLIGFGLPFAVKKFYPNKTTTHIENNIFDYFDFPSINYMIRILESIYGRKFGKSYFKELLLDKYEYKFASKYVKPLIEKTMGADTIVFSDYHEKEKNMTSWYIEPDSSIKPKENDAGVEVVSPPLPAKQSITDLKKFFKLAKEQNFYTGKKHSTGLHINVSIPKEIDALKLAVFLGDQYVLKQFDRENNDFAISVITSLKDYEPYPYQTTKTGHKLNQQILRNTIDSITDDHYASISIENSKYISFRHVGGDYLTEEQDILNTVGRFVRAMIIASDPNIYRDEYLKKLTKLFELPKKPGQEPSDLEIIRTTLNDIRKNGLPIIKVGVVSITKIESSTFLRNLINNNMPVVPSAVLLSGTLDYTTDTAFNFVMSKPNLPMLSPVPQMKANKDKVFNYYSEYLPKLDDWALRKLLEKKGIDIFYSSPGKLYIVRYVVDFLPPTDPRTQRYYNEYLKKYYKEIKFNRELMSGQVKMQTDESLGLGYPGTYEQEYNKFKSKSQKRNVAMTNEALDSSYDYQISPDGRYHFITDNNIKYRVTIIPTSMDKPHKSVEVLFSSEKIGGMGWSTTITGTGDSYKVLGTVAKIVKDYAEHNKPNSIYFSASVSEPSRIKLYDRLSNMVSRALPDYYNEKPHRLVGSTYYIFKRKENINEALDSSYPYEGNANNGRYHFETEDDVQYKVYFGGQDLVEISFSAILPGEEDNSSPKTTITGTGNSRKIFGTVVKIVQDYLEHHEPNSLYFTADSDEPSRVKLYNTMISQVDKALPNYYSSGTVDLGTGVAYMLKRKDTNLTEAGQAPIYYFAYGMLTDPQIMHGVDMVGPAELKNFEYQMYRYANVAPKAGSTVEGVLWEIDRDFLSYLDQIEGYPQLYDRRTYPVYVDGQKYVAEVYVMTPATINHMKGSTPDGEYLRSIVSGYRNAGISTDQLKNSLRKK